MRSALIAALLPCLAACGGGDRVEGLQLTLGLTTSRARSAVDAQGTRTLLTDAGARASLSGALVTLGSVELMPCEPTGWRRLLHELSPVGTAWAHSASSPRRLGTPHVVGLGREDGEVTPLGVLRPPPGSYCRARLTFEPADADAQGLSSAAEGPEPVDMLGRSLHLRGLVSAVDGSDARPFEVESSGRSSVDVLLDGVTLSEEAPEATLVFSLAWDTWLDGVGPQEPPSRADLLGNVARSVSLRPAAGP